LGFDRTPRRRTETASAILAHATRHYVQLRAFRQASEGSSDHEKYLLTRGTLCKKAFDEQVRVFLDEPERNLSAKSTVAVKRDLGTRIAVIEFRAGGSYHKMEPNVLYLSVSPLMNFNSLGVMGLKEFYTLYASKDLATQFFPDELDRVEKPIRDLLQQLRGGHVVGYDFAREAATDGRVILKVIQHVE